MSFLKRLWGYITTLFKGGAEKMMKPEVEIEQAINEAKNVMTATGCWRAVNTVIERAVGRSAGLFVLWTRRRRSFVATKKRKGVSGAMQAMTETVSTAATAMRIAAARLTAVAMESVKGRRN